MKKIIFFFTCVLLANAAFGQTRKYVNEFMHLGVGGRQLGMGKAGIASTNDVYATYWNPAGLSHMKDNLQVGFMHNFYFQSIANFDYLALAVKGENDNAFGFSMLRFGVDGILNTLDLIRNGEINYNRVTEFSAVDYAFMPSYGKKTRLIRHPDIVVSWGGSGKIVHRKVGDFARAWGFGLDAGFRIDDYNNRWGLALVMRDITGTYNNWRFQFTNAQKDILAQTGNIIPVSSLEVATPRFSLGGYSKLENEKFFGLAECNLDLTTDGKRNTLISSSFISGDVRIGVEGGIKNEEKKFKLSLRAGLYNFQRELK
ncbi:MAG: hypothetical protein IT244_01370, partial [Bacteroidia bacterium]|nr:hypothetical protein [Bacteroidia bacterium]